MKKKIFAIGVIISIIFGLIIAYMNSNNNPTIAAEKTGEFVGYNITYKYLGKDGEEAKNREDDLTEYEQEILNERGTSLADYYTLQDLDNKWYVLCDERKAALIHERYNQNILYKLDKERIQSTEAYYNTTLYGFVESASVNVDTNSPTNVNGAHEYSILLEKAGSDEDPLAFYKDYGSVYVREYPTQIKRAYVAKKDYQINGYETEYNPERAYLYSTAYEKNGSKGWDYAHESNPLQWANWDVNTGNLDKGLIYESQAFGRYRRDIENKKEDEYITLEKQSEYPVNKNEKEDSVIIGPFKINYAEAWFKRSEQEIIEFAGITNAKVTTDAGELDNTKWEFVLSSEHKDHDGNGYKYPNDQEEFYIKIKKYSELKNIIHYLYCIEFEYEIMNVEAAYARHEGGKMAYVEYNYVDNILNNTLKIDINHKSDGYVASVLQNQYACLYKFYCSGGTFCTLCGHKECKENSGNGQIECDICPTEKIEGNHYLGTRFYDWDNGEYVLKENGEFVSSSAYLSDEDYERYNNREENGYGGYYGISKEYYCKDCYDEIGDYAPYWDADEYTTTEITESTSCEYNSVEKKVKHKHNAVKCDCEVARENRVLSPKFSHWPNYETLTVDTWVQENYPARYRLKILESKSRYNINMQDLIIMEYTKRWYDKYSIKIDFTKGIELTVDISGHVYNDRPLNKETVEDGIITYNQNGIRADEESGIEGIEVQLYTSDNTLVGTKYTDANGDYKFEDMPLEQYYVKFIYDGLNYEATTYLAECPYDCASKYSNYTKKKCEHNSKAQEDPDERKAFNEKFSEITPNGTASGIALEYDKTKVDANGYPIVEVITKNADGTIKEEFKMLATTELYPVDKEFALIKSQYNNSQVDEKYKYNEIGTTKYYNIYDYIKNINLGLKERDRVHFATRVDFVESNIKFNGKSDIYTYPRRATQLPVFDIGGRSDSYYYTQEQRVNANNVNAKMPLEVYVTYTIKVMNKSQLAAGYITEIANYYDTDFELSGTSYIKENGSIVEWKDTSIYGSSKASLNGANVQYTTSTKDILINPGEAVELQVTYKVKSPYNLINGYNTIQGKEKINAAEINGYKTVNAAASGAGEPAGIIDMYSIPGNAIVGNKDSYENDADEAPLFKLVLGAESEFPFKIGGYIWEDDTSGNKGTTVTTEAGQVIADGKREDKENKIENVIAVLTEEVTDEELVTNKEIDGTGRRERYVRTTTTNSDGYYAFENVPVSKYKVTFVYGTGEQLNKSSKEGKTIYSGQDYQATFYKGSITEKTEDKALDVMLCIDVSGSMGTDTMSKVKQASKELIEQLFAKYSSVNVGLIKFNNKPTIVKGLTANKDELIGDIYTLKGSGGTNIANAVNGSVSELQRAGRDGTKVMVLFTDGGSSAQPAKEALLNCEQNGIIPISVLTSNATNIFGTEDNPTAGFVKRITDSEIINVFREEVFEYIIGTTVQNFQPNTSSAQEVAERRSAANTYSEIITNSKGQILSLDSTKLTTLGNATYINAVTDEIIITSKHKNERTENTVGFGITKRPEANLIITEEIESLQITLSNGKNLIDTKTILTETGVPKGVNNWGARKNGAIQAYIDPELMQGATVKITYKITVKNDGQVDTGLLYGGLYGDANTITTTKASKVYSYVDTNLVFRAEDNTGWTEISVNDALAAKEMNINDEGIKELTVLQTIDLSKALKPGESTRKNLVLTKVITPENTEESLEYGNSVEIVETINTVGRRSYKAIPGNYNPISGDKCKEPDTAIAREIRVLPPFGEQYIYYVLGTMIVITLAVGIVLIKKKVLDK